MARFHTRGKLANGQPVIVKVEADNVYDAAAQAGKIVRESGQVHMPGIRDLRIRPLSPSKSGGVYVGQVPAKRARKAFVPLDGRTDPTPSDGRTDPTPSEVATPSAVKGAKKEPVGAKKD